MEKEFLKIEDAARLVGRSVVTIRRAIKAHHLFVTREETKSGFNYLIQRDSLLKYYSLAPSHDQVGDEADEEASPSREAADGEPELMRPPGQATTQPQQSQAPGQNGDDQAAYAAPAFSTNFEAYFAKLTDPYKETLEILRGELAKRDQQLQVKDEQLARKDDQISVLLERMKESHILLAQSQGMEAKALPESTLAAEKDQPGTVVVEQAIPEPPKSKGFWRKLFNGEYDLGAKKGRV